MKDNTQGKAGSGDQQLQEQRFDNEGWKCTQVGRIVYKRKKNSFTPADFQRIWRHVRENMPVYIMENTMEIVRFQTIYYELQSALYPEIDKSAEDLERAAMSTLQEFLSTISIAMLEEIIDLIPFVPKKVVPELTRYIYWTGVNWINSIFARKGGS